MNIIIMIQSLMGSLFEEWEFAEWAVVSDDPAADTIINDLTTGCESVVIGLDELGETELSGDEDLLSTWELHLGSSEGLSGALDVFGGGSDGHENLTDVYSCRFTETFTEGTSHTLLESIGTSARKHLVDSNDVPWVDSDSHVEVLSSAVDLHVFVTGNSSGLKSFGGDLLLLVANQMDAGSELVVGSLLPTDIVESELCIGDTSVESRFWIRLVLLVPVAPTWSSSHLIFKLNVNVIKIK